MQREEPINPIKVFFKELVRRRVLKIGGAYIAGAWLGAEIISFLLQTFGAPDWSYRLLAIVFVVGFPVSMVLAWVIQVSEEGHLEIDRSRGNYAAFAVTMMFGLLIAIGLAWLTLEPPPPYQPRAASLAVLPFLDEAATPDGDTMSNRLYVSLMEGLEQSDELSILMRLPPSTQPDDPRAFAKDNRLKWLTTGTIRHSAQGSRLVVQLSDVVTGKPTWSETYAWDATLINETTAAMANDLLLAMGMKPITVRKFRGTNIREAYQAFIEGEVMAAAPQAASLRRAIEAFEKAIELDATFVRAHAALAQSIFDLLDTGDVHENERPSLEQLARHAIDVAKNLDPDSADVISLLGLELENRYLRAQAWERAIQLDPDHAVSFYRYAVQQRIDGDLESAEQLIRTAVNLRPGNERYRSELEQILNLQERHKESNAN